MEDVKQTKEQSKQDIRDQKAKDKAAYDASHKDKAAYDASHKALEVNKVAQAEARLKYLLGQSDMLAHFGVGKGRAGGGSSESKSSETAASNR